MTACILHVGAMFANGYGVKGYKRKTYRAHRLAYALHHNLDPSSMGGVVMHSCDNRACVNPAHLSLGTHQANMADMVAKDRQAKGSTHGRSILSEELVGIIRARFVKGCRVNGCRALGRELGIDATVISELTSGKTYT